MSRYCSALLAYEYYVGLLCYNFNYINVIGKDKNKSSAPKRSFLGEPSPEDYVLMKEETFNLEPV